jgi:hypothetical protein
MTSVDELKNLVRIVKEQIASGEIKSIFSAEAIEHSPKNWLCESKSQYVQIKQEDGSTVQRHQIKFSLRITFEDARDESLTFESKPCLIPLEAEIQAAHGLLDAMSCASIFTETFRCQCKQLYIVAFNRGRELFFGGKYPFSESMYLEFKSSHSSDPLSFSGFKDLLKKWTPKSITAFINSRIATQKRPSVPCKLIFGVKNDQTLNGVAFNSSRGTPAVVASQLQESIRQQLRDSIHPGKTRRLPIKGDVVASAVKVNIHPIKFDDNGQPSIVIVIVSLMIDAEHDIVTPCFIKKHDHGNEKLFGYIRTSQPSTMNLDTGSIDELFPNSEPPALDTDIELYINESCTDRSTS